MKAHSFSFQLKGLILLIFFSFLSSHALFSQDNEEGLGLPGDNLNLFAVLDIFQKAKTLEDFERSLNAETNKINNLDLDNDGRIDYLKVIDNPQGNTHAIILQVDLNRKESQDIAVIYVDKNANGTTDIQIVGDEDLYGKDYVVEPDNYQSGTANPGYSGNRGNYDNNNYTPVSDWGVITYIYSPFYSSYVSPWYWGYYPGWWRPWNPFYWHDYYYHCHNNYQWYWGYSHYNYCNYNRFRSHHNNWYHNHHRRSSVTYHNYRNEGKYRKTYQGNPPVRKPAPNQSVYNRTGNNSVNRPNRTADRQNESIINRKNQAADGPLNRSTDRQNQQGIKTQDIERTRPTDINRQSDRPINQGIERSRPTEINRQTDRPNNQSIERSRPTEINRQTDRPNNQSIERSRPTQINRQADRPNNQGNERSRPTEINRQERTVPAPREEMNRSERTPDRVNPRVDRPAPTAPRQELRPVATPVQRSAPTPARTTESRPSRSTQTEQRRQR